MAIRLRDLTPTRVHISLAGVNQCGSGEVVELSGLSTLQERAPLFPVERDRPGIPSVGVANVDGARRTSYLDARTVVGEA